MGPRKKTWGQGIPAEKKTGLRAQHLTSVEGRVMSYPKVAKMRSCSPKPVAVPSSFVYRLKDLDLFEVDNRKRQAERLMEAEQLEADVATYKRVCEANRARLPWCTHCENPASEEAPSCTLCNTRLPCKDWCEDAEWEICAAHLATENLYICAYHTLYCASCDQPQCTECMVTCSVCKQDLCHGCRTAPCPTCRLVTCSTGCIDKHVCPVVPDVSDK